LGQVSQGWGQVGDLRLVLLLQNLLQHLAQRPCQEILTRDTHTRSGAMSPSAGSGHIAFNAAKLP
jgi:hypothetical protein